MTKTYPQRLGTVNSGQMGIWENFDGGDSYEEDYQRAVKYAKKIKGEVYTVVDAPGTRVSYIKGNHHVDRIGYIVVKWKD